MYRVGWCKISTTDNSLSGLTCIRDEFMGMKSFTRIAVNGPLTVDLKNSGNIEGSAGGGGAYKKSSLLPLNADCSDDPAQSLFRRLQRSSPHIKAHQMSQNAATVTMRGA